MFISDMYYLNMCRLGIVIRICESWATQTMSWITGHSKCSRCL